MLSLYEESGVVKVSCMQVRGLKSLFMLTQAKMSGTARKMGSERLKCFEMSELYLTGNLVDKNPAFPALFQFSPQKNHSGRSDVMNLCLKKRHGRVATL